MPNKNLDSFAQSPSISSAITPVLSSQPRSTLIDHPFPGILLKESPLKELRHSTGSVMHLKGAPVLAIKDQLRHTTSRTTESFYIGSDLDYQRKRIEKLSNDQFSDLLKKAPEDSEKTVRKRPF